MTSLSLIRASAGIRRCGETCAWGKHSTKSCVRANRISLHFCIPLEFMSQLTGYSVLLQAMHWGRYLPHPIDCCMEHYFQPWLQGEA